jgi:hypothetical protein
VTADSSIRERNNRERIAAARRELGKDLVVSAPITQNIDIVRSAILWGTPSSLHGSRPTT